VIENLSAMEKLGQPIGVNDLHIWSIWASDMAGLLDFEVHGAQTHQRNISAMFAIAQTVPGRRV
jgi:hypothetical protein